MKINVLVTGYSRRSYLAGHPGAVSFHHAEVTEPGVLAANRAGLSLATRDVLCFDDDTAARPDWIARFGRRFCEDPRLGALGDWVVYHAPSGIDDEPSREFGGIRRYGRIIGNTPYYEMAPTLRRAVGCASSDRGRGARRRGAIG